jgi:hypothetical protein
VSSIKGFYVYTPSLALTPQAIIFHHSMALFTASKVCTTCLFNALWDKKMKATVKEWIKGFSGKLDGAIYYYYPRLKRTLMRRAPKMPVQVYNLPCH